MADWDEIDVVFSNQRWWFRERGITPVVHIGQVTLTRYTRSGFPIDFAAVDVHSGASTDDIIRSVEFIAIEMLKKPSERVVAGRADRELEDAEARKRYPVLWEYLTAPKYPDGQAREPSSLLVFWQEGMLKGMLRDKDAGLCVWGAATSLFGLLEQIDGMLGDPACEWRVDRQQSGQQARRVVKGGGHRG